MIALRGAIHSGVFSSLIFYIGRLAMPPIDVSVWGHATLLFRREGGGNEVRKIVRIVKMQNLTVKDVELIAFASRYEIAAKLGGSAANRAEDSTITIDDLKRFLDAASSGSCDDDEDVTKAGHRMFYRHCSIKRLEELLETRCLVLSCLSEMNDLDEYAYTKDASCIYLASMRFGALESMGMWKMYGAEDGVRLGFDGNQVRKAFEKIRVYELPSKDENVPLKNWRRIPAGEIDWVSFHDVAYKYGTALEWNHKVMGPKRCPGLEEAIKNGELATYVKRYGWSGENESRLVVKLKPRKTRLKRIAVDFGCAIDSMRIMLSPENSKLSKVYKAYANVGIPIEPRLIEDSSYAVSL